tara:strand:- start:2610 stop:3521 length:912 start_codon:yes stop_codon:yes gene_type:complete
MDKNLHMHELTLNKLMEHTISHLVIIESIENEAEAYLEAEVILSYLFQTEFINLRVDFKKYRHAFDKEKLNRILIRRISGEPLAYITSVKHFYDLILSVGHGVLVPRSETELLIDEGINQINILKKTKEEINVVDVGTGSGAIIISIAKNITNVEKINLFAIDNSKHAIKYCKQNIKKYALEDKITVIHSDLLTKFHITPHIIFANLPYIDESDMFSLQKEIRNAEPSNALNGDKDGLAIIIKLLKQLSGILNPKMIAIILEIGINQDDQIKRIVKEYIPNSNLSFINDYQGIKRVAVIKNKN